MLLAPHSYAQEIDYSDTTKPQIESLVVNPSTVDVSQEGAVLLVTVVGSDDRNVITYSDGYLDPLYGANPQSYTDRQLSVKKVGSRIETTLQLKFVFKKGTPIGSYKLRITLYDAADNRLIAANLDSPSNSVTVVNGTPSRIIDVSEFDYNSKLDNYANTVRTLTSEISSLKSRLDTQTKNENSLQSQINTLTSDKSILQSQVSALTIDRGALQKRISAICKARPRPKGC